METIQALSFRFPRSQGCSGFLCGMASAGSRPSGHRNHRLSSICPSLTPFFQQAGLKSVCRGGFGVVLYRIWARRRVSLEAPRHDQGYHGAFGHHDPPGGRAAVPAAPAWKGARTSGDVPPPARGALKRPHAQKREKRTKREEAFICEGARLGSFCARCYNIRLFY